MLRIKPRPARKIKLQEVEEELGCTCSMKSTQKCSSYLTSTCYRCAGKPLRLLQLFVMLKQLVRIVTEVKIRYSRRFHVAHSHGCDTV